MRHNNDDIQGRLFGFLPYDFRLPTMAKVAGRIYQPGGPVFVPKVFGAGWTLNFASRRSWLLLGGLLAIGLMAALTA